MWKIVVLLKSVFIAFKDANQHSSFALKQHPVASQALIRDTTIQAAHAAVIISLCLSALWRSNHITYLGHLKSGSALVDLNSPLSFTLNGATECFVSNQQQFFFFLNAFADLIAARQTPKYGKIYLFVNLFTIIFQKWLPSDSSSPPPPLRPHYNKQPEAEFRLKFKSASLTGPIMESVDNLSSSTTSYICSPLFVCLLRL